MIDQNFIFFSSIEPSRQTLVFIHGFPDNYNVWQLQKEHFSHRFNLLFIAMPGTLDEEFNKTDYNVETIVSNISNYIEEIPVSRTEKLTIIGHDMGGPIAHKLALKYNTKAKLILVNTYSYSLFKKAICSPNQFFRSSYILLFQLPLDKYLKKIALTLFSNEPKRPKNSLDHNIVGINSYRENRKLFLMDKDPIKMSISTLVIWGINDPFLVLPNLSIRSAMGEKCNFKELDSGHWPMFQSATEFNRYIEDFL